MRTLILRCWAVDPELCPKCGKEMKRSKALTEQAELQRLLKNLGIGLYPTGPGLVHHGRHGTRGGLPGGGSQRLERLNLLERTF